MKLALSLLNFRPGRIGGAETYLRRLLQHLPTAAGDDRLVAIMDRDVAAVLATPGFERVVVPVAGSRIVRWRALEAITAWRARAAERIFDEVGADATLFPQQSIFPLGVRCPAVLTVIDLQHVVHPENFSFPDRLFRAAIYPRSLARADRVIAISDFTRRMLVERSEETAARIVVVPFGIDDLRDDEATSGRAPSDLARPYLYYPAATYPHKNHATLLRTFAALRRDGLAERLVFTGQQTREWSRLRRLVRDLRLEGDVAHLGFVSAERLGTVYAGAEAVVIPSLFEGFGLPVFEAVARGKKVVVSRLPVFDEIGVPGRFQADFAIPDEVLAALRQDGPTILEKAPPSWKETATRTIEVLRGAARSGP